MRHFIYFSYDGTAYHGWQVQPNAHTVQQELQTALSRALGVPTEVVGAGRTDTGVHARLMVAHFDTAATVDAPQLAYRMRRMLPPDISVDRIRAVKPEAHARFSALSRTYHYTIYIGKQPFLRHYAVQLPYDVDFGRMNEAATVLLTASDFSSFSKVHTDVKTFVCRVERAAWEQQGDGTWRFEIRADRFLRNMVRAVVGTLLDVGRGRLSVDDFRSVVASRNRCAAGESVPARGLALVDIAYPPDIFLNAEG